MNTNLSNLVKCLALTITCLQPTLGSENDFFFTHLLRNLKNDILNLKPGSNKTYIINSKLLGRNDSIELDIKSRAKGTHNEEIHETHHKEETHGKISHKEDKYLTKQHVNENNSLRNRKGREELRHKIRKAMMKEFEEIQKGHNLKIRKIMKHNRHDHGRKKIRIKVLRKERTHEVTEAVEDIVDEKSEVNFKAKKKVKSIKILHLPVLRKLKRAQRGRKIVNGKSDLEISDDRYDNSDFDEGGQIPELFGGEDLDPDQISALFENTKDLEVYVVTTTSTTTTTTTTEPSTKNVRDEYTYEYVYEDELEKGKGLSKDKNKEEKKKGAKDDEYTYEYIYEDEMRKGKATAPPTTPKPTETTTTTRTTTEKISEESEETQEHGSKVHEPIKLSPSVEKEVEELRYMERNMTTPPVDTDEYFGDSNSQYKEPERFMYESEHQPQDDSQYPTDYDWNCPAVTTAAQTFRIAASSIMYDDEDTEEFLAQRNKTKMERGYDSYPANEIFTCDIRKLHHRYTRPKLTPEWYDSVDEYIDHWGGEWEDHLQGHPTARPRRNKTSMGPIGHTKPYNTTRRRQRHNATFKEQMEYKFDLDEMLKNSTNLWMKNITQTTTHANEEDNDVFVTIDDINRYRMPEILPERKIRRMKRDIGGGMKMPRRQYEVLMYLAQKVNHTRWIARLKKMKAAPNLMELLIKKHKKKVNKKGMVYKQKAVKPKKRPKGPKRVVLKKRKPKENRRAVRVKLGAQRRQKKQQRKRRSVDINLIEDNNDNRQNYIDIEAFNEKINNRREKRDLENVEVKLVRKKRKVVDKLSDDLLYDFEQNPEKMQEDNEQDYIRMSSEKLYEDEPQNTGAVKGYTQVFKRVPDVNYSNSMTPRIRTNPKLWMTHDLLREVFKRDELFFKSKYKEPNNTELRQDYVRQRNKCNRLLVKAKNKYTKQLYYYGTHNLNETQLVHEVQNRRLSDVLNTILKHIKCPHCTRFYDDFKLKGHRNRSRLTYKFPRARFMTRKTVTLRGGRNTTILTATRHP